MKDSYVKLMWFSSIVISLLLSVVICFCFHKNIVSVDLLRILNAQAFNANKKIYKNPHDEAWIDSVKEVNASIRQTIKLIAGKKTIVIVSPAVIQGVEDITDKVLVALNLPKKLPNVQDFFMPAMK